MKLHYLSSIYVNCYKYISGTFEEIVVALSGHAYKYMAAGFLYKITVEIKEDLP